MNDSILRLTCEDCKEFQDFTAPTLVLCKALAEFEGWFVGISINSCPECQQKGDLW